MAEFRHKKKHNVNNDEEEEEEEDRLSSLPDEILTNILSHLPINSAAATTVLSHRWLHLWTAVTRFEFHGNTSTTTAAAAAAIVDHILHQLTAPKLTTIDLGFSSTSESPKFWLTDCRRRKSSPGEFVVPSSLFISSQSLLNLSLFGRLKFDFPDFQFQLPNLKQLKLDNIVAFTADWLGNLIRSCPLLECLDLIFEPSLRCLSFPPHVSVEIFALNLKSLKIHVYGPCSKDTKFYISAPKLASLDICDSFSLYYLDQIPTTLVEACIDLRDESGVNWWTGTDNYHRHIDYIRHMSSFVHGLSSVTTLDLAMDLNSNIFHKFYKEDVGILPIFPNLTCFVTTLMNGCHTGWMDLLLTLQCFPNLLHLEVTMCCYHPLDEWSWRAPDFVPNCLVSELKTIKIFGYCGVGVGLELLEYILSHAVVLEELHVTVYTRNDVLESDQLLKERNFCRSLFKLPRKSPICEVMFSGSSIKASSRAYEKGYVTCELYLG